MTILKMQIFTQKHRQKTKSIPSPGLFLIIPPGPGCGGFITWSAPRWWHDHQNLKKKQFSKSKSFFRFANMRYISSTLSIASTTAVVQKIFSTNLSFKQNRKHSLLRTFQEKHWEPPRDRIFYSTGRKQVWIYLQLFVF